MKKAKSKSSVSRLFWEQVTLNFVVVAVLIALGALLTFNVMGEEYGAWTVVGFFATVFFAFIVFLPAGTLFAARAEFAKGKVEVREDEKSGALQPIANPLLATAPLGAAFAAAGAAIVYGMVYWGGWLPSPLATTLASFAFVVPYAIIVRLNIFRDIEGLGGRRRVRGEGRAVEDAPHLADLHSAEPRVPVDHQPAARLPRLFARCGGDRRPGRTGPRAGRGAGARLRHHLHVRLRLHLPCGDGAYGVGHVRRRNDLFGQGPRDQRILCSSSSSS